MSENKERKRILMLNYEFPPLGGGGGIASKQLAKGLIENDYQVDLITGWMKGLNRLEKVDGINVYRVQTFGRKERPTANNLYMATYLVFGFLKGIQLCWKNKYDFINTQFVLPTGPLGFILGKFFGLKNILSIHGGDIYDPSLKRSPHRHCFLRKIIGFLINGADKIVAQSSNTKENVEKYYHFNKEIIVIPLAYEKFNFQEIDREKMGLDKNKKYLISVGRIVKRKGYKYLIRALAKLKKNICAIIISDGPEKNNLKKLAKKLGVEKRIIFTGMISEEKKFQYLSNADIYILSSLHEGFGIVLQEAMQVGLPIVATDDGGQVDLVKDGYNGYLVKPKNIIGLVNVIKKILSSKKTIEKMVQNSKEDIENFNPKKIAKKHLKLIGTEEKFKDLQKNVYEKMAKNFDKDQKRENRNHYNKIRAICDYLDISEGEKVLEIGVGTAIHGEYLINKFCRKNFEYYGIDYSPEMIAVAEEKLSFSKNIHLECMDGEKIKFENGFFDKVYISGSLHHYSNLEKGISEMARVLKKGGRFCIMEPNWIFPTNIKAWLTKKEEYNMRKIKESNFHYWLRKAGIKKYKIINFAYTPPFPEKIIPIYDILDKIIYKIPLLNKMSVMLFIKGKK